MSQNINQVYIANPITTNESTDLMYFGQSPYGAGNDAAMTYANFVAQLPSKVQVQRQSFNFQTAGGVNDAFTVALSPAPSAYTDGMLVTFKSGLLTNLTTTPTLNVNGLGARTIVCYAGSLIAGDIQTTTCYLCIYNASSSTFQLINPSFSMPYTILIQENGYNLAIDSGVADAYVGTILPQDVTYTAGLFCMLQVRHTNTGASTFNLNGLGVKNIVDVNNNALVAGQMVNQQMAYLLYSGEYGAWVLMNPCFTTVADGGTGKQSLTAYTLLAGGTTSTGAIQQVSAGTSGQLLKSNGASALPSFTTATFPATAGSAGTILRSDGTNWVASTATFANTYTASNLLYSNGSNTVTGLATANNGVLVTNGSGVPSIGNSVGADLTINTVKVGLGANSLSTNTAIGVSAIGANAGSNGNNTAIGYKAMFAATNPGEFNTFVGGDTCGDASFTGSGNTGVGQGTLGSLTSGSDNTAIGYSVLTSGNTTTASQNTVVGRSGFNLATSGSQNVGVGYGVGRDFGGGVNITTGTYNTFLGYQASSNSASTIGSIAIGANSVATIATGATSGDDGPGIAIGSASYPVGFRGNATIYPTAGAISGYAKVNWNGTFYKIALYALS